jgi:hypothetical protein
MNIDKLDNNIFLKKLFPNGIVSPMLIGRFNLDLSGYCDIDIHVKQEPALNLKKYGNWGEDFNVIVLKLKGKVCGDILITNWSKNEFVDLEFAELNKGWILKAQKNDFKFYTELDGLIFQEISVYLI